MTVDWLKIKTEYINGNISYRKLADKYGVSFATLRTHADKEQWVAQKEAQQHKVSTKIAQKTVEKISEGVSDEAAAKVRIRGKLIKMAENWVDAQSEIISDTNDFRRMVQSCIDLGVMEVQDVSDLDNDGLLEALSKNAHDIFDTGDDSEMVLEDDT